MKFDLETFYLRRNDTNYIKELINSLNNENDIIEVINNCSDMVLTDDISHVILNKISNWNASSSFCSSYNCMKLAVRYNGENLNFATCEIDEELFDLAMKNGLKLSQNLISKISKNKTLLKKGIEEWGWGFLNVATCEIDEELFDFAIKHGYMLNEHSISQISGNKTYVKKFIEEWGGGFLNFATCEIDEELIDFAKKRGYQGRSRIKDVAFLISALGGNYLDNATCKIDEKLFDLAIEKGYRLNVNSSPQIKRNKIYVKQCIEKYGGAQLDYATCEIDEKLFDLAIEKGYRLNANSSPQIKRNKIYVKKCIEKYGGAQLDYATCEIDEELIDLAIEKGYMLGGLSSPRIRENEICVKKCIEKYGIFELDNATCEIDEELFDFAMKHRYMLNEYSISQISGNENYVKQCIEKYGGDQLDYATCEIDEKLFDLAIEKGYSLNASSSPQIKRNKIYVKKCIEKYGGDQLDYATCEIDKELINFAVEKGYMLSERSSSRISGNEICVKKCIEKYGGDQLDYATCEIDKELIDFAIVHGFAISVTNFDNYSNINTEEWLDYFFKEKSNDYKEKINLIKEKTNSVVVYILKDNLLLNEKIVNEFGVELVVKCIKYLYLVGKTIDLKILLNKENMTWFKFVINNILGKSLENISIDEFYQIINNYSLYNNLILNIVKSKAEFGALEKEKIITLFKCKDDRFKIENLSDLNNVTNMVISANQEAINSGGIYEIKNAIYLTNFNINRGDVCNLKYVFQINAGKINDLTNSINNEKNKSILENYLVLFEMLDYIEMCQNEYILKEFLKESNNKLSNDGNYFNNSHELFLDVVDKIKHFYGAELFEKMSNNDIENEVDKIETSLQSTDGKAVSYLNMFNNKYYFQHTLNAYGSGGKLSDFKNPRLVGKNYICLSLIDNNHKGVNRSATDVDHVTLLFDKLPPTSLCKFAEHDIFSYAEKNSRNIQSQYSNFDTVDNTLNKTSSYNEYVYYRENDDGSYIYPSGILVTGDKPNQAEIDAAAYLSVPLIKLNPVKEKEKNQVSEVQEETSINKKEELIKELKMMKEYLTELELSKTNLDNNDVGRSR